MAHSLALRPRQPPKTEPTSFPNGGHRLRFEQRERLWKLAPGQFDPPSLRGLPPDALTAKGLVSGHLFLVVRTVAHTGRATCGETGLAVIGVIERIEDQEACNESYRSRLDGFSQQIAERNDRC